MAASRQQPRPVQRVGRRSIPRPAADPRAWDGERPAHLVRLPRFFIARYPVTVAQWRAYYQTVDAHTRATLDPRSLEGAANHPVVCVSWHDALAYCRWLTRELRARARSEDGVPPAGRMVPAPLANVLLHGDEASSGRPWVATLPSEEEWERAQRGYDGRRYWMGALRDGESWEMMPNPPLAVGVFPGGRSPTGTEEHWGNVWEWTRSLYRNENTKLWSFGHELDYSYPCEPDYEGLGRENLSAPDDVYRVVFRSFPGILVRAHAYHEGGNPSGRGGLTGFRVAVSPFVDPLLL